MVGHTKIKYGVNSMRNWCHFKVDMLNVKDMKPVADPVGGGASGHASPPQTHENFFATTLLRDLRKS